MSFRFARRSIPHDRARGRFPRSLLRVLVLALLASATAGPAPGLDDQDGAALPDWFFALRIAPSTSSRGLAMTIPVELIEFHPRDAYETTALSSLMPDLSRPVPTFPDAPGSPDASSEPPYSWDFSHGFGQLMAKGSPFPCRVFVLRLNRMEEKLLRATLRSIAPLACREPGFATGLSNPGLAIVGLKGTDLTSIFPGLPMGPGPTKLSNNVEIRHSKTWEHGPTNRTYAVHALPQTLSGSLATRGLGGQNFGTGLDVAEAALGSLMAVGAGNGDETNLKEAVFTVNPSLGAIPRPDRPIADLKGNLKRNIPTKDLLPDDYCLWIWPFASTDGTVTSDGWVRLQVGRPTVSVIPTVLPATDQAELYATVSRLMLDAWRWRQILNPSNHSQVNVGYPATQTLMRISEPLWTYITIRTALDITGPERKRWGDNPVARLNAVSTLIWSRRLDEVQNRIENPDTFRANASVSAGGVRGDSFFPSWDDSLEAFADRIILRAIRGAKGETELKKKLTDGVVDLIARGYTRGSREVLLKERLEQIHTGAGGYTGANPKLEPDLFWLGRAMAAQTDRGDSGLARPLAVLAGSQPGLFLEKLVGTKRIEALEWTRPPSWPPDAVFAFSEGSSDPALSRVCRYAQIKYRPQQPSQRILEEWQKPGRGWTRNEWYTNWCASLPESERATDTDRRTYDYYWFSKKLDNLLSSSKLGAKRALFLFDQKKAEHRLTALPGAQPDDAARAVATAIGVNVQMIEKFEPPDKAAKAKSLYWESSVTHHFKPATEMVRELWSHALGPLSGGRTLESSMEDWRTDLERIVSSGKGELKLIKSDGAEVIR